MVGAWNSVHHRHMPLLVAAELPQHPVDGVLLHIHVEQQRRPRHPVLLVAEAQLANLGFEARVGQDSIPPFMCSSNSDCRSKIELLCEFRYVIYVVS
jgi:hypothetical protein